MPDRRRHRGAHPEDAALFSESARTVLRAAAIDFLWLLNRRYGHKAALKIVGDHFSLTARQRIALERTSCSDEELSFRLSHEVSPEKVAGEALFVDGYNILTTVEAAMGGGIILVGRDGCYRDMASLHGSYRRVAETGPAIHLIGRAIAALSPGSCTWYLDSPVSNSGRLKTAILAIARSEGWEWRVECVPSPDRLLISADGIVATADSGILDRGVKWVNLGELTVGRLTPSIIVSPQK